MKPIVFVGPSLSGVDCTSWNNIDFAGPANAGDILLAVASGRRVIGLIDGGFETKAAVWHKEIHAAISAGCTVYGAASMGALRAAEMMSFGMIGIGQIFEDYAEGRREADADVALVFGPAELKYKPLSLPLVDCETQLVSLLNKNKISAAEFEILATAARSLHFKQRTWETVVGHASALIDGAKLSKILTENRRTPLKTRDALLLLNRISVVNVCQSGRIPKYVETKFLARLRKQMEV